ncbi:GMC family oxidoreductase [Methylopila sp. M107]|uniref:FAD-dependent oxidoreductase n=1 Tax=Methylopila sp. M107 TaxID=1101190 RepID=UPI00037B8E9C|nr:GMC family oxidoreductase [Methylopila sp. M107]
MITDLETQADKADIVGDICIVGTGPAGLTIALELAAKGRSVILLEAGGEAYEAESQALYEGKVVSSGHIDIADSRLRQFGGTSGHWTGVCVPMDPIDFEPRAGSTGHGWPIRRSDLDPFYVRAQSYLDAGPFRYGWTDWRSIGPHGELPLDPARVKVAIHQQSPPTRYAEKYLETARAERRIDCRLHANVVDIMLASGSDRVESLKVSTLAGAVRTVRAKTFVIACGAVENARLLLNARRQRPAGIGNERGLVGRYFNDHMTISASRIVFNESVDSDLYRLSQFVHGAQLHVGLALTPDVIRKEGLNNTHSFLKPTYADAIYSDDFRNYGWVSFSAMVQAFSRGSLPDRFAERYCDVVDDVGGVATGIYRHVRRKVQPPARARAFILRQDAEQAPNPDSRVTLGESVDRFGMNTATLDWRIASDDLLKLRRMHEIIGTAIGAAGLGRMQIGIPQQDPDPAIAYSGYHHMGTTRMHAEPALGVVDADCRVHTVKNLYMAGSSVFTTGGCANPTLTIVALAIRLAEHLAAKA